MENKKVQYLINIINDMDLKDKLRLAICMSQSKWAGLIYNTKENYEKFDKKDNQYFISLKDLSKKYKYNFDNFINKETHKECDKETSGIYFDTDNVRKLEYFKNPIVIDLKCE